MNYEQIGSIIFGIIVLGSLFVLVRATIWNKRDIEDDFEYDFEDWDGNHYKAIEHRGQKVLQKIPDEVEAFLALNRADRTANIESSERKAKRGLLEKVVINGAIAYLAKGKEIKETVKETNKRNER